ncbi:MAG: hypothetical protein QM723_06660 [Myxococcaceae bacterium]
MLEAWRTRLNALPSKCLLVGDQREDTAVLRLGNGSDQTVRLRDPDSILAMVAGTTSVHLDISGLAHTVWAPILRAFWSAIQNITVVYAEPIAYKVHTSPTSSSSYDLTDGFQGVGPLPGFAKLRGPDEENLSIFIPMLGFEGVRARQVAQTLDPVPRTIPIIGVPGFRLEYPAHTVSCNREFLSETDSYPNVRYAKASCPFQALDALNEIRSEYSDHYLYIAPVGTKPHSVAAVIFATENSSNVELMYDHPKRKPQRTQGVGPVHFYRVKCP